MLLLSIQLLTIPVHLTQLLSSTLESSRAIGLEPCFLSPYISVRLEEVSKFAVKLYNRLILCPTPALQLDHTLERHVFGRLEREMVLVFVDQDKIIGESGTYCNSDSKLWSLSLAMNLPAGIE